MLLTARRIQPADWTPIDVEELEANALDVVRSTNNRSVIAGPGSGKTELLAQRAAYLLQCGIAEPPRRILAISYKRDAARNIAARVRQRCHPNQAHRFDSQTFDAFAKSLVDRFGQALPARWRPTSDYRIAQARDPIIRDFLQGLAPPAEIGKKADIMAIAVKTFEKRVVRAALPEQGFDSKTPAEWAVEQFWESWLHEQARSSLTFAMIGRLAELLVRTNPVVRKSLRLTYPFLFMDEFQDTTRVQYDLVKTIFRGSQTVVTAVGDKKQQIMRWAMAMEDPFGAYEADFGAVRTPLVNNYRSSPALVKIQGVLAKALDDKAVPPKSKSTGSISGDSCAVWDFTTPAAEAQALAAFVASEMATYKLKPRDFALLVRMRAAEFIKVLGPAFAAKGLTLRNEAAMVGEVELQVLLAEDFSQILMVFLRLATMEQAGPRWTACIDELCFLWGLTEENAAEQARAARELDLFAEQFRAAYPSPAADKTSVVVKSVIDFVGRQNIASASPAYHYGDWLDKLIDAATLHLQASCSGAKDWTEAVDRYEGLDSVPLMTVHKSKGLEYHTMIFVGLEDTALFNFQNQTDEETAGFFVAFSRARQRALFTYCPARGDRNTIAPLYQLLDSAGVKTFEKG